MEKVSVENLESRIKSISQAREYFSDCNLVLLKDKVFDTKFVLDVFKGHKLLIPASSYLELDLKRMKLINEFNRENLFKIIAENDEMRKYIPDSSNFSNFDRNSLLVVSLFCNS